MGRGGTGAAGRGRLPDPPGGAPQPGVGDGSQAAAHLGDAAARRGVLPVADRGGRRRDPGAGRVGDRADPRTRARC